MESCNLLLMMFTEDIGRMVSGMGRYVGIAQGLVYLDTDLNRDFVIVLIDLLWWPDLTG